MNEITTFLSHPVVALVGYALSLLASIIAIMQYLGKSKALDELSKLKIQITNLQSVSNGSNKVQQGERSQYFQENSGAVNIDNRG